MAVKLEREREISNNVLPALLLIYTHISFLDVDLLLAGHLFVPCVPPFKVIGSDVVVVYDNVFNSLKCTQYAGGTPTTCVNVASSFITS